MGIWNNGGMGSVDLECGMECYIGGESIGFTGSDCSIDCTLTTVDLYQGQPAVKVGSRIAKIEGKITLGCLEQTPENMRLASSIGHLVKTTSSETKTVTSEYVDMVGTSGHELANDNVTDSTIVVKSEDGTTTYTLTTDYTVSTSGTRTSIARVATGSIENDERVAVNYTYTETTDTPYLFFGEARSNYEVEKVVFHKVNPDATDKQHHIIICWRAVAQGNYNFKFNETSQNWMSIGIELGLLSDASNTNERHNLCPLFMETWQDSFDINNLPSVPETYTEW